MECNLGFCMCNILDSLFLDHSVFFYFQWVNPINCFYSLLCLFNLMFKSMDQAIMIGSFFQFFIFPANVLAVIIHSTFPLIELFTSFGNFLQGRFSFQNLGSFLQVYTFLRSVELFLFLLFCLFTSHFLLNRLFFFTIFLQ